MSLVQTLLVVVAVAAACARDDDKRSAKTEPAVVAQTAAKQLVAPPRPEQLQRVTIKALGMYCEDSCPLKVRHALADIASVYELGFDVSNESIFVSYDRSLGAPKDITKPMLAAIKGAGFDPWLAKEDWPADANAQVVLR